MKLTNIHNVGRTVYLFTREDDWSQSVTTDNTFYPYFFIPDSAGECIGYLDKKKYKKVFVPEPRDVRKCAPPDALGVDIPFTKNYLLDNKIIIENTKIKIGFVDIEVKTDRIPKTGDYTKPISSIAAYDYSTKRDKVFFVGDYNGSIIQREKIILSNFCAYIKEAAFDIILIWNGTSFDLPYLTGRYPHWAEKCSPVGLSRYGYRDDLGNYINLPVGVSVLDYMELFKKYTLNKWPAYNLNFVLEQEFGEGKEYDDVDFDKITDIVKERNRHDVIDMARLEDKFHLIEYFQELRNMTYCDWEDLPSRTSRKNNKIVWNSNNSRLVDSLLIKEAKDRNVLLPNKNTDNEVEDFDGAFRECYSPGLHTNVGKYDLTSAYPSMITGFTLDTNNFTDKESADFTIDLKDRETLQYKTTYYLKNDSTAIIPSIVQKFLKLKDDTKAELKKLSVDSEEYKLKSVQYKSIKSLVNTYYGVLSLPFFRLYDIRLTSITTFLVRDLLYYIKNKIESHSHQLLNVDTDSLFINTDINLLKFLNEEVKNWSVDIYKNTGLNLGFELEGFYSSLLLIAKCRYYGRLQTPTGFKEDKCGIESLRNDSTIYMKEFQTQLLNKVLDNCKKADIIDWIKSETKRIKTLSLKEIAKPVKVQDKEYKTEKQQNGKIVKMPAPPAVRAMINANRVLKKSIEFGQRFYLINMLPFGEESTKHPCIHIGFTDTTEHIDRNKIDWDKVIELNILNKAEKIFEVLKWDLDLTGQLELTF